MSQKYTPEQLKEFNQEALIALVLSSQEALASMEHQLSSMNQAITTLTEQIRLANANRFGRKTEKLDQIAGQLSLFDEVENNAEEAYSEGNAEEEVITKVRKKKPVGKAASDYRDFKHEPHLHKLTDKQLDAFFGAGCWRRMDPEEYVRLRFIPGEWICEDHSVDVAVGTTGDHQDEFLRAKRPADVLRNSIVTPSLEASIINGKYTNALPLDRIAKEFQNNGVNISKQTMCNWTMRCAEKYFKPMVSGMKAHMLQHRVLQADETTVNVIHDEREGHAKSFMWVYRSGQFYDEPVIIYEYRKTRHHDYPAQFLREFRGVLETDGLQQYHMLEQILPGFRSANCWCHARRSFTDALKAMGTKADPKTVHESIAYQALEKIGKFYKIENTLANLPVDERLTERQSRIKPLVEDYFAWVKKLLSSGAVLPKGKTAEGLNYCINQEKYLKVFLEDGSVPIDNLASERAIRPFTIGRNNWMFMNTIRGAECSAAIYSLVETAKANGLHVYRYFEYLLTELAKLAQDPENLDEHKNLKASEKLDPFMPWSKELPAICRKPSR